MAPTLAGRILLPDDEVEGWVQVVDGRIADWGEDDDPPEPPTATGWIVPAPVNAHTHVADAFLRDVGGKPANIPELVGPGGWKHRQIAMARRGRMGRGVARYTAEMAAVGTTRFLDFREGGTTGVQFLRDLRKGAPWMMPEGLTPIEVEPFILGRPKLNDFDPDEAQELLETADGVGLSGLRDFADPAHVAMWAEACHAAGRPFALHASEDKADDMDTVLSLDPSFLVHMVHASRRDVQACADAQVPIVLCPRSNRFFGHQPPVIDMLDAGCLLALGTDNGMLQDGDLLAEVRLLCEWLPDVPVAEWLRAATYGGRMLCGLEDALPPRKGAAADLVVWPEDSVRGRVERPGFVVGGAR